jgi:phosphoribosylformylglycinamidine (FGAM) synthase-like enzyme
MPPTVALADENRLIHGVLPALIQAGFVQAARVPHLGGLAIALSKMLMCSSGIAPEQSDGAVMPLKSALGGEFDLSALAAFAPRLDTLLFGETHGSVVIAYRPEDEAEIAALVQKQLPTVGTVSDIAFMPLGTVTEGSALTFQASSRLIQVR